MTRSQILTLLMDLGPLTFEEVYWSANRASACQEYRLQWEVQSLLDLGLARYEHHCGEMKLVPIISKVTAGVPRPQRISLAHIPASCVESK